MIEAFGLVFLGMLGGALAAGGAVYLVLLFVDWREVFLANSRSRAAFRHAPKHFEGAPSARMPAASIGGRP